MRKWIVFGLMIIMGVVRPVAAQEDVRGGFIEYGLISAICETSSNLVTLNISATWYRPEGTIRVFSGPTISGHTQGPEFEEDYVNGSWDNGAFDLDENLQYWEETVFYAAESPVPSRQGFRAFLLVDCRGKLDGEEGKWRVRYSGSEDGLIEVESGQMVFLQAGENDVVGTPRLLAAGEYAVSSCLITSRGRWLQLTESERHVRRGTILESGSFLDHCD